MSLYTLSIICHLYLSKTRGQKELLGPFQIQILVATHEIGVGQVVLVQVQGINHVLKFSSCR